MSQQLSTRLESIASKIANESGFSVSGFEALTHKKPITMQVQISGSKGKDVSLDDCISLSKPIKNAIDSANLICEEYILEISSPGIGDYLKTEKDFQTFRGFPVEISTKGTAQKAILKKGLLHDYSPDSLKLNIKGRIITIPNLEVLGVKLTTLSG